MNKQRAKKILRSVDKGVAFRFVNGQSAVCMEELIGGIESLTNDEYQHHVYFDHNDFSNWLIDVIDDHELALHIFQLEKKMCEMSIKKRIVQLEKFIS